MLDHLRKKVAIAEGTLEQVISQIFADDDIKRVYFLSPVSYESLRRGRVKTSPDAVFVDSVVLVRLLNMMWRTKMHRYSFDTGSLAPAVYSHAHQAGLKVAIVGATETECATYCEALKVKYPAINLVFRHHGFFNKEQSPGVIAALEAAAPQLIVVGLGAPAQELFCDRLNLSAGQKVFTCGGHITQSATEWNYYPKIVNAIHMRWLYRLIKEPHTRKRFPSIFSGLLHIWKEAVFT